MNALGAGDPDWAISEVFGFNEDLLIFFPQPNFSIYAFDKKHYVEQEDEDEALDYNTANFPSFYRAVIGQIDGSFEMFAKLHACLNKINF